MSPQAWPPVASRLVEAVRSNTIAQLLTTSYVDVGSMTVTARSAGSVKVTASLWIGNAGSGANRAADVRLLCDGAELEVFPSIAVVSGLGGDQRVLFTGWVRHTPTTGEHTWKLQARASHASSVQVFGGIVTVAA